MRRVMWGLALSLLLAVNTGFAGDATSATDNKSQGDQTVQENTLTTEQLLQKQLEEMKKLMEEQNLRMAEQEERLAELESKPGYVPPLFEMVRSEKADTWLPSMKSEKFELGGELEFEHHYAQEDTSMEVHATGLFDEDESHSSSFDMDKADIYLKAKWNDVVSTFFEIEFFEAEAHVDTAYAQFDFVNTDDNSFTMIAGLDHQFTKYSRNTENYPLAGAIFWRDEFSQIHFHGEHSFGSEVGKWLYWDAMIGNSYDVDGTTSIFGENHADANELLQDDNDYEWDFDGAPQWGLGIGVKPKFKDFGNLDARIWYIASQLRDDNSGASSSDLIEIAAKFYTPNGLPTHAHPTEAGVVLPGLATNDDDNDKTQFGGRLMYDNKFWDDKAHFSMIFEYITAEDGDLERDTWYLEGACKFKLEGFTVGKDEKWFTAIQPLVRYEDLDIDDDYDNNFASPVTWDRQRWMLACNIDVCKNVKLRFEYQINDEDIDHFGGGRLNDSTVGSVDNDEFNIQLELKF